MSLQESHVAGPAFATRTVTAKPYELAGKAAEGRGLPYSKLSPLLHCLGGLVLLLYAPYHIGFRGNRQRTAGLESARRGRSRTHVWALFQVLATIVAQSVFAQQERQAPAELFKQFVSSPPDLSDLTWAQELSLENTNYSDYTNYNRLRYEPQALFLGRGDQTLLSRTDVDAYISIVSSFGDTFWARSYNALYVWTNTGNPREIGTTVDALYSLDKRVEVTEILSMGLQQAQVGSIRWQDDSFAITNAVVKRKWGLFPASEGYWLSGKLIRDGGGRAARLIVERRSLRRGPDKLPDFVLTYEYSYDRPLALAYLPSTISVYYTNATKAKSGFEERLRIINVQVAPSQLPEAAFSLWPYVGSNAQYKEALSKPGLVGDFRGFV